ncbi:MAG TPA: protein kinase [Streptosporangiaceae bacterium]|nr:protein kinase [Streptosporangiaceae bacterium]
MTEEISSAASEIAPGGQLAGYQIEAEIGRGGMAIVYRALDVKLGRTVALKILAPRLAEDQSFRRRFIHESRAAAAVDHPHIVPVFEAGESDGCLFIAMRYVGTGDVRTLLERQGRLSVPRAVAITAQVASALDAAHARGLVHRDIKPANMLLAESGDGRTDHVYLSDFGLSKQALAPTGLTSTGQFLGTLDYVAPEQIEGRTVDGRADLYALACATVEMLTGAPPFRREENLALMWAQLSEPPPALTQRRPDLPPAVDQVIGRALAKSPTDRYRTCMDYAAALRAACASQPGSPAPSADPVLRSATELAALPRSGPPNVDPLPAPAGRLGASQAPPEPARVSDLPDVPESWWRQSPGPRSPAGAWGASAPRSPAGAWGTASDPEPAGWLGPAAGTSRAWGTTTPTAPPPPPGHRAGPGHRRGSGVAIAAVIVLLCLAGLVGYRLLHRGSGAVAQVPAQQASSTAAVASSPARTVEDYFRAINHHRYGRAWLLGGRNAGESYAAFASGFSETAHDAVKIISTNGRVVTVRLVATQTDGSVQTYQGGYTVMNGQIVRSNIHRVS